MERESLQPITALQQAEMEVGVARYATALLAQPEDSPSAAYLAARGLSVADALGFRLGVVDDPLPEHAKFRGWLAIPYLDLEGKPLSVRFRCLQSHDHREHGHGKYMTLQGDHPRTFNVKAFASHPNEMHVTEGEMDAIVLTGLGLPAVGLPGATQWRERHRRLLQQFDTVYVWGDPDEAGVAYAQHVCQKLSNARTVRLTVGDVSETYVQQGSEGLFMALNKTRGIA